MTVLPSSHLCVTNTKPLSPMIINTRPRSSSDSDSELFRFSPLQWRKQNAHGSSVTPMTSVTVGSKTSLSSRFQSLAKIVCSKAGHFWL